jgi:Fic family protein
VGQGEAAYCAFLPDRLPPTIAYDLDLVQSVAEAAQALGELAGLGRAVPNPHLLIRPFLRREAVLSSRIEGTRADITDLYAYEAGQLALPGLGTSPDAADVREVLNYVHALEYGLERIKDLPLSLRLIRELHERLMAGVRGEHPTPGEFRHSQNWIGGPGSLLNDARFVPPPVEEMAEALYAFERYLHEEDKNPPLVRLGLIHYRFEAIHPFLDGNGRIGRLLISLLLIEWNLLPLPLLYLSAYFEKHRQVYYDLLFGVSERGAWETWLLFFLRGVAEQAHDANRRLRQLQDLQLVWRQRMQEQRRSTLLLRVIDLLFEAPLLSAGEVGDRLHVSAPSAMQALHYLEQEGVVREVTGRQRYRIFLAEEILQIIS